MQNDCKNCIHLNVCAYVMPDIPTCDSFLSKDILDKIVATGNVYAISTEEMKAIKRLIRVRGQAKNSLLFSLLFLTHTISQCTGFKKETND